MGWQSELCPLEPLHVTTKRHRQAQHRIHRTMYPSYWAEALGREDGSCIERLWGEPSPESRAPAPYYKVQVSDLQGLLGSYQTVLDVLLGTSPAHSNKIDWVC